MPKTTIDKRSKTNKNKTESLALIRKAIIQAPTTIKGERIKSLSTIFTVDSIWKMSGPILVIKEDAESSL